MSTYLPTPDTQTVPLALWKSAIDEYVTKYGVKWLINSKRQENDRRTQENAEDDGQRKRRKRGVDYTSKSYHRCNRTGKYKPVAGQGGKDQEGRRTRPVQTASKKIGCRGKLVATCFKNDPENVVLEHVGEHNHVIGSSQDIQHLPLSQTARKMIEEHLREGYRTREVRISIQRILAGQTTNNPLASLGAEIHRDHVIDSDTVYNIYKKIQLESYKKAGSQEESVKV